MHFFSVLSTMLLASRFASARPNDEDSSTVTDSASLTCPTGEASSKYESCSSSISSEIAKCGDDDLGCACDHANSGFACLTSYCPQHTPAVCEASLALSNLCALVSAPGPTLTGLSCPSDVPDLLASLLSTDASDIESKIPSDVPFFGGASDSGGTTTANETTASGGGSGNGSAGGETTKNTFGMSAPSQTGGAGVVMGRVGDGEGRGVLVVGIWVCVAIGGLAALL